MTRNEAIDAARQWCKYLADEADIDLGLASTLDLRDIIHILSTPPTVQDVVRVKGLVWEEITNGRHLAKGMAAYHRYMTMMANDGTWIWCDMYDSYMPWQDSPSLDAAKAACQAHYEQMVMQHLEVIQ